MKKRIFMQTVLLASSGILLAALALSLLFYNQFAAQARADLQERTQIFLNDSAESALEDLVLVRPEDMRITIILPDGTVFFDNMADPHDLAGHLDREEIEEALSFGAGESRRFSDTLGTETYYYAVKLTDGTVLRTAKTVGSVWSMFAGVLPVAASAVFLFVIAGYFVSGRLAKKVVEPIGRLDFSGEPDAPYDELTPFIKTIVQHRRQIAQDNEKLQARVDTIDAIMDNMDEGVVLLDRRGLILSVNKSAARIFDTLESMEGRNALELLRNIEFSEDIQRALQGFKSEMALKKSEKEYRVLISPVAEIGVVVLFLDITEKSEAERMRREFSANVSHELKTPLTSIYGNAEMLKAGLVKDPDKPLFYSKIMDESSRLIALIEDIIMLSELDEGRLRTRFESVNLADVASECAQALEQKAAERGIRLSIAGAGAMLANRSLIYEMFYNLIDNAIKYNKTGGNAEIVLSQTDQEIRITVSDSGIGIPEDEQKRIFERFYRVDKSRSKKSGGTGLGLAIVKHVVLTYGGTIRVVSKSGEGTAFIIVFSRA